MLDQQVRLIVDREVRAAPRLTPAGERILAAASTLFYEQGIRTVGVDAIECLLAACVAVGGVELAVAIGISPGEALRGPLLDLGAGDLAALRLGMGSAAGRDGRSGDERKGDESAHSRLSWGEVLRATEHRSEGEQRDRRPATRRSV